MSSTPRLVNRLRLKHWSLLSALGETATLNQAALRISVTQPSATKMLSDIEAAFGFALADAAAGAEDEQGAAPDGRPGSLCRPFDARAAASLRIGVLLGCRTAVEEPACSFLFQNTSASGSTA